MKPLITTLAQRLIVAADFKPEDPSHGREWVREQVLTLADALKGTGVYLKVNSALRACGYSLIDEIHSRGLLVFADLKLFDIGETLSTDGALLAEAKPELLTTVCNIGIEGLEALKKQLPDTEVLGVTVLTSLTNHQTHEMFGCSTEEAVMRFARVAVESGIDGVIAAPTEATPIRNALGDFISINTPGIRPSWKIVEEDDQNPARIMTPAKAIEAGADRIVVGRPIIRHANPRDAVMRTLEEIESALRAAI